mmetsp:Transcript_12813/g.39101  ORF Transcript_12813/g.39101 Transcript_12813/m.39101 type:complete len:194 (+) Transcript_12813:62-643(+)
MAIEEFMRALRLEIFAQYNHARTDPLGYSRTAGLPPHAAEMLQRIKPVPAFEAISDELSAEAMNKVKRLGFVEEEPDEILGEKPYLHCLGMGADDDLDGADVVASATNVIVELLLDEDKLPVAFDPFFTALGIAIGPNRKHGTVTCIHLSEEWDDDDNVPSVFGNGCCRCCVSGANPYGLPNVTIEIQLCTIQ